MPSSKPASTAVRRLVLAVSTAFALVLLGCAAPSPSNADAAPNEVADNTSPASTPVRNPPRPPQLPPVRRPMPQPILGPRPGDYEGTPAGATVQIDRSCDTDAECTVKNVGNCCGYYPACVNVDSPTDPEGVKAQCAKTGMASVCGFPAITSCECVAGQCEGSSRALLE